jgi:putative DNA primase/helicase
MLTGRDLITAEKKFQQSFHFTNYAKLMFSANKVPEAYDDTAAFFRRWIIIVFPNVFISGDNADPHILDKLTTEEELSGLLNLALAGLKRLQKQGAFSYSKTTEEIKEDYIRKSSPIAAFVMDCLETDSDAFIVKKELYNVFTEYCRQLSLPTVTQDTFFKNLPQHAVVMDYRPSVKNKRYYTFKGIKYTLNNLSNLSMVSRVFYTLVEKRDDYEDYEIEKLNDHSFIKVRIPLDSMDSLDTNPTTCWLCHEALPSNLKNTTVHEGKTVHTECYKKLKLEK